MALGSSFHQPTPKEYVKSSMTIITSVEYRKGNLNPMSISKLLSTVVNRFQRLFLILSRSVEYRGFGAQPDHAIHILDDEVIRLTDSAHAWLPRPY